MLISEFARATGLSADTVRFYVRRGFLDPEIGSKGGRNPYQVFSQTHVRTAEMIRLGRALGLSLKEIGPLLGDYKKGLISRDRAIAIMSAQRQTVLGKAEALLQVADYLALKISWMQGGERGPEPRLEHVHNATGKRRSM